MKTYTLTESELQELLEKQREICAERQYMDDNYKIVNFNKRQRKAIKDSPSPLLPTLTSG